MDHSARPLAVTHVLEALASAGYALWGKERLVEGLMLAQRASGDVDPRLVTFTPCALADVMRGHGFEVDVLEPQHRRLPARALPRLRASLALGPPGVLHTHGYKANIVGRLARLGRSRRFGLLASCHAWFDESFATRSYNALDRRTAFASDLTTVADARMLSRFGPRDRVVYVANGIPSQAPAALDRAAARARFGFTDDRFVVGFLARTDGAKGIPELLAAARESAAEPILWAIAGTGRLAETIARAELPNVRYLGHVADTETYRAALDAFVQASKVEGLSLSLLEAMRAGLPIVATAAGSTTDAVRDGCEALVVTPGDAGALLHAVRTLVSDAALARRLGAAARARFARDFRVERQHRDFLDLYRACAR